MNKMKIDIKDFTLSELRQEMLLHDQPMYRAEQIFFWLYHRGSRQFSAMRNMPKIFAKQLDKKFSISTLKLSKHLISKDGTEKLLFQLEDESYIETVLIAAKARKTICISTQVGCKFACPFCASGKRGYIRDLTAAEMINQILYAQQELKHSFNNYVFMGMGEPLDNVDNLISAIKLMNEPKGMAIGARRITVSTCGIVPGIEKLSALGLQINLSVSLHATDDEKRNALIPINKRYCLDKLTRACDGFIAQAGRMVTYEYIMFKGVNDSSKDASKLAAMAKRLRAKVNLITCSPISGTAFIASNKSEISAFMKQLSERGVNVTLRESKGAEIYAACGQLAGRMKKQ